MSDIHQEVTFKAKPARIYEALMDSREHEAFTANGAAQVSRDAGGAFSCHGGHIEERNIELLPNKRIIQAWRAKNWPEGIYSIVRFELKGEDGGTRLIFDQTGAPEDQREMLESGWHKRYWEPLAAYLAKS